MKDETIRDCVIVGIYSGWKLTQELMLKKVKKKVRQSKDGENGRIIRILNYDKRDALISVSSRIKKAILFGSFEGSTDT